jgi:hypothetical protein
VESGVFLIKGFGGFCDCYACVPSQIDFTIFWITHRLSHTLTSPFFFCCLFPPAPAHFLLLLHPRSGSGCLLTSAHTWLCSSSCTQLALALFPLLHPLSSCFLRTPVLSLPACPPHSCTPPLFLQPTPHRVTSNQQLFCSSLFSRSHSHANQLHPFSDRIHTHAYGLACFASRALTQINFAAF